MPFSTLFADIPAMMAALQSGAFLTVQDRSGRRNVMTLGWATIGFIWGKPVFMAPVRPSRFTYELLTDASDFTLTIPSCDKSEAIKICGSKSGRDIDKFAAARLFCEPGRTTVSPVTVVPGTVLECRIMHTIAMGQPGVELTEKIYPKGDVHTMFFGEITARYEI